MGIVHTSLSIVQYKCKVISVEKPVKEICNFINGKTSH